MATNKVHPQTTYGAQSAQLIPYQQQRIPYQQQYPPYQQQPMMYRAQPNLVILNIQDGGVPMLDNDPPKGSVTPHPAIPIGALIEVLFKAVARNLNGRGSKGNIWAMENIYILIIYIKIKNKY